MAEYLVKLGHRRIGYITGPQGRRSTRERLEGVSGVQSVTHNTWFGGIYQDPTNFFAQIAVEPEKYFPMYPEFRLPPEQMQAWLADRQGAEVELVIVVEVHFGGFCIRVGEASWYEMHRVLYL